MEAFCIMIPDVVVSMIDRYGETVTYRTRTTTSVPNTLSTTVSEVTYSVKMQIALFNKRAAMPGLVQDGDLEGRIAASNISFTPAKNDRVTRDNKQYTVVNVDKMTCGGQAAVYILVLRGAQ